jgi:hypothetical protein
MIDIKKKYQTKQEGLKVDILAVKGDVLIAAVKLSTGWQGKNFTLDGIFQADDSFSLVEVIPFFDYKIDDKCLFWNDDPSKKVRGHYAGTDSDGYPYSWDEGKTSFTTDSKRAWANCEKLV